MFMKSLVYTFNTTPSLLMFTVPKDTNMSDIIFVQCTNSRIYVHKLNNYYRININTLKKKIVIKRL